MEPETLPIEWRKSADYVAYEDATAFMEQRVASIRAGSAAPCVWLLEHAPLYTAGTSAKPSDLLDARFPVYESGRGGQFTYHGPGQRVGYVMLDMKRPSPFNPGGAPDVRGYVTFLETWIINTLARFGLAGRTYADRVGVWVDDGKGGEAKIAAIGIRIRHWVSFHGIALNVNPDLSHFGGIVPCGIREHGVTSLHALGINATMDEVDAVLKEEFGKLYFKG
jgi:lipoyl(octanoyl) transferase